MCDLENEAEAVSFSGVFNCVLGCDPSLKEEKEPLEEDKDEYKDKLEDGEETSLRAEKVDDADIELQTDRQIKICRRSSIMRFQMEGVKTSINENICQAVAVNTNQIPWHSGPHCMNCYLGEEHECWDEAKDTEGIQRKVFFVKNGGESFEISKSRTEGYVKITYIVKYLQGTPGLPFHDHPQGEEYLVLDGAFDDTQGSAPAGTYVKYPNGTSHSASPVDGAKILTWWGQNNNDDEAEPLPWWGEGVLAKTLQSVDTAWKDPLADGSSFWTPVDNCRDEECAPVAHQLMLFRGSQTKEQTYMLRLSGGAKAHKHVIKETVGGIELYVLSGCCVVDIAGDEETGLVLEQGWWMRELPKISETYFLVLRSLGLQSVTIIVKTGHLHTLIDS